MALGDEDLGALLNDAFGAPKGLEPAAPEEDIVGLVNDAFAQPAPELDVAPAPATTPAAPRALTVVPPDDAEPKENKALSRLVNEAFSSAYPVAPKFIPRSPEILLEWARTAKSARDAEVNAGWAQLGMDNPFSGRDLLDVAGNIAAGVTPDAYEKQVRLGLKQLSGAVRAFGQAVGEAQAQRRQDIKPVQSIVEENAPTWLNARTNILRGDPEQALNVLAGANVTGLASEAVAATKETLRAEWEQVKVTTMAPLSTFGKILGTLDRPLVAFERADYEWRIAEHNKKAKKGFTDPSTGEPFRPIIDPATGEPFPTTPRVRTFGQLKDEILSVMDPIPDNDRENVSWADVLKLRSLLHGGTGSEGWILWVGLGMDVGLSPLNLVGVGAAAAPTKLARLVKISDPLIAAERLVDPVGATTRGMAKVTSILREVDKGLAAKAPDPVLPIRLAAKEIEAQAVATRGLAEEALYANRMADARSLGRQADKYDAIAAQINHTANSYNAKSVQIAIPLLKAATGGKVQPLDVLDIPTLDTKWRAREVVKIADRIREEQSVTAGRSIERLQKVNEGTGGLKRTDEELDYITHVHEWPHEAAGRAGFKASGLEPELAEDLEASMRAQYASLLVRSESKEELFAGLENLMENFASRLPDRSTEAIQRMMDRETDRIVGIGVEQERRIDATVSKQIDRIQQNKAAIEAKIEELTEQSYWEQVISARRAERFAVASEGKVASAFAKKEDDIYSASVEQYVEEQQKRLDQINEVDQARAVLEEKAGGMIEERYWRGVKGKPLNRTDRDISRLMQQWSILNKQAQRLSNARPHAPSADKQLVDLERKIARSNAARSVSKYLLARGATAERKALQGAKAIGTAANAAAETSLRETEQMGRGVSNAFRRLGETFPVKGSPEKRTRILSPSIRRYERQIASAEKKRGTELDAIYAMFSRASRNIVSDWEEYNAKLATLDKGMTVIHETVDAANREARYRVLKAAPEKGIEELDAYLAHVNQNKMRQMESLSEFQKVSPFEVVPRPNPTKHRVIRTTDEARRLGFDPITNPLELATHTQVAARAIVTREKLKQEIIKQFGFETKGRIDPTRYVSFEYKGKTYAVPRDVKDGLAALDFVMSPVNWPKWIQQTGAVYNAVQNFWKRQVLAHPSFATVNALGNRWLNAIGGGSGDPRSAARAFALAQIGHLDRLDAENLAAKAMAGAKPEKVALSSARAASYGAAGALAGASVAGPVGMAVGGILGAGAGFAKTDIEKLGPAARAIINRSKEWLRLDAEHQAKRVFFDPNGRKYTGRELYDWADGRVFERGWVAADAPTSRDIFKFQSAPSYRFARNVYHETLESVNPLGSQNVITKTINSANKSIENHQRFEFMLDRILVSGDDPLDAIDRTNAVFGNYKKQGKFGLAMGKAFPFYKWIRTNARAEFEGVFRSPAMFAWPEKIRTAFGKYYEGTVGQRQRILSRDTAYFIQKAMGFPVPSSWFLDGDDSAERLVFATTNMPYGDINLLSMDAIDQWIGMMGPIFKAPSEVWKRRRFDTGERLDEPEILPESLDPVGEWLAKKFPNDVTRENVKLSDGTTKVGYAVPKYMLHLLRSIEPGPDRWEKLLIPRGEKEEAIRQSLRRQTELLGIVSGREIQPERETANVLKRGWNAETDRPRGGGGYERIRQLNAKNRTRFGQRPLEEK